MAAPALRTEDPAVAIAMGLCLTARSIDPKRGTEQHPRKCGWCVWPLEELRDAVREFNAWADFDDRRGTSGRHATRSFAVELSRAQRQALIVEAQAFEPDASEMHSPAPDSPIEAPEAFVPATDEAPAAGTAPAAGVVQPPEPPISTVPPEQAAIDEEEYLPWKR